MRFTRSLILKTFDNRRTESSSDNVFESNNNNNQNQNPENLSPEEIRQKFYFLIKKFFNDNYLIDKYICLTFSLFCYLISLCMSYNIIFYNDNYCLQLNTSQSKGFSSISAEMESSSPSLPYYGNINKYDYCANKYAYEHSHKKYLKIVLFFNFLLNFMNLSVNMVDKKKDYELSKFSPLLLTRHWHVFKTSIVVILKITFLGSYLLNFSFVMILSNMRTDLAVNQFFLLVFVFEIYSFYSVIRCCIFFLNFLIHGFLLPMYIASIFIAAYEDRFNYEINKMIKTEVKQSIKIIEKESQNIKRDSIGSNRSHKNFEHFIKIQTKKSKASLNKVMSSNIYSPIKNINNDAVKNNDNDNYIFNTEAEEEKPLDDQISPVSLNHGTSKTKRDNKVKFVVPFQSNEQKDSSKVKIENNEVNIRASIKSSNSMHTSSYDSSSRGSFASKQMTNVDNNNNQLIRNDVDISRRSSLLLVCAICLSDLIEGDLVSTLPCNMKHSFHTFCLENWFEKNSSCPICRSNFNVQINEIMRNSSNNNNVNNLAENLL